MDIARARFLTSPRGRDALVILPGAYASLPLPALATALRRDFPPLEAAALGEQVTLAAKAAARFGPGHPFLLTETGLEMMTHPLVAERRARRLAALGHPFVDLTTGLGGDLRAAAQHLPSAGLERDPATALLAVANVPQATIVRGEATSPPFALERASVLIDPSRRAGQTRSFDPAAFSPPFDAALGLIAQARTGVLKAPPGIDHRHLPPNAEVEFVQLGRTLREATVWVGEGTAAGRFRAVLLPLGAELDSTAPEAPAATTPPASVLHDPESCVTRASLVRHLAHRLGASLMDPQVAYLTADAPAFDPLCATFEILEAIPFSIARVRDALRRLHLVPDEIRRRAFPIEPDDLRRQLGRFEGAPVTLICTTIQGRRLVFLARRLRAAQPDASTAAASPRTLEP